jgi:transcriptional regulator with XRE-family HTH domain
MTLGERIQEIRKARGYKQQEVADLIGIDVSNYARIERNEADVSITRLEEIAKALKVNVWAFFVPHSGIVIIGDVAQDAQVYGNNGTQTIYPTDFNPERGAYLAHIANLEKQIKALEASFEKRINSLEKQLDEKQQVINKLLSK